MKNSFNFTDWIKQKLEDEKGTFDDIKKTISSVWEELKYEFKELKDDSHLMVPILNGLMGDTMEKKGSKTLVKMSFRYDSRNIAVEKLKEHYDFSKNNGKVVFMLHGLMCDESIWHSEPKDGVERLGTHLENQEKATVVYIRYNTGLHISENGKAFNELLQQFIDMYQDSVKELVLIGHSMGGLVLRSACYYADIQNKVWLKLMQKVFLIGVPNEGSYLAKIGHMTQYFFRKIDPTENDKVAKFFDMRSNGIKDLSFGYLVDEDWQGDEDGNERNPETTKVLPLANVDYYLLAATVADDKNKSRIFTFFGDGLVEKESALSDLFKTNEAKEGKVEMKLFIKENHLSLIESKEVLNYVKLCLDWD